VGRRLVARVVIVGTGHAGFQCAASLRQEGFTGEVVLVGDEPALPYQRPPLSKAYLLGASSVTDILFRPPGFYEQHRVERILAHVEHVDRPAQRIVLRSGATLAYDHLVIATGSRPRRLAVEGSTFTGVMSLQTLPDADLLRQRVQEGRRVVVIGAGFIGLEFAAVARTLGLDVVVLDVAQRALARAASAELASVVVGMHQQRGVQLRFGCGVAAVEGAQGTVSGVRTADGDRVPADLVLVGIGAEPRTQLATAAGLRVDNGIVVDQRLLTSDPSISAIGDVAAFPDHRCGGHVRLESVQNATDQARCVAGRLTGKAPTYDPVPWFWSDQGDLKLQIAGLRSPQDEHVVLATPGARACSVLCIREGRLAAVETIDRPADHMLARRLLAKGVYVSASQARQPGFALKALS
jgi:3-phenylpropionate/trans-cinnamate dioxygenase ferredoxin reductase component